jgi:hypothetical protein
MRLDRGFAAASTNEPAVLVSSLCYGYREAKKMQIAISGRAMARVMLAAPQEYCVSNQLKRAVIEMWASRH